MHHSFPHRTILAGLFALLSFSLTAQPVKEPPTQNPYWSRPFPSFRIAGNLYYVGTHELACYLITTPGGHILINTGLAASLQPIQANIQSLGFRVSDIKLLLTTQAHHDHLGAMAAMQRLTGAKVWVNTPDAPVLADGGRSDYALGTGVSSFEPVKADSLLKDGAVIRLGGVELTMLSHPGHTKGSCSYLLKTKDSVRSYTVLIANLPTIVTDKKFSDIPDYPGIANDYATTIASLKSLRFDLWVASHASQFQLHHKYKPGKRYNPTAFQDKAGFDKALGELERQYKAHLRK
jgi:metallo-beta-lactamase class B